MRICEFEYSHIGKLDDIKGMYIYIYYVFAISIQMRHVLYKCNILNETYSKTFYMNETHSNEKHTIQMRNILCK